MHRADAYAAAAADAGRILDTLVLIAGQLFVEHVFNYVIPISVFITIGGGVYFLYLLLTTRKA